MVTRAGTNSLVFEPIGQTTTTELNRLILAAYLEENGIIERPGSVLCWKAPLIKESVVLLATP